MSTEPFECYYKARTDDIKPALVAIQIQQRRINHTIPRVHDASRAASEPDESRAWMAPSKEIK